jgi:hypothetical protein
MNFCLHKKGANNSRRGAGDKREFGVNHWFYD